MTRRFLVIPTFPRIQYIYTCIYLTFIRMLVWICGCLTDLCGAEWRGAAAVVVHGATNGAVARAERQLPASIAQAARSSQAIDQAYSIVPTLIEEPLVPVEAACRGTGNVHTPTPAQGTNRGHVLDEDALGLRGEDAVHVLAPYTTILPRAWGHTSYACVSH